MLNTLYKYGLLFTLSFAVLGGCQNKNDMNNLKTGIWRGTLQLPGGELPFNFTVSHENDDLKMTIHNGEERLDLTDITMENDSLYIPMHIFENYIRAKAESDSVMSGTFIKKVKDGPDQEIPFHAVAGVAHRFQSPFTAEMDIEGKWEAAFQNKKGGSNPAIAIFNQQDRHVTGTFLTTTGDYRYLEGIVTHESLLMSTFDGEHAYLFQARLGEDSVLRGDFWSGNSYHTTWTAHRNDSVTLPDADTLTYLKKGFETIEFSFPGLEREIVSLEDEKYKDKAVIVQLLGSWCPNCMDETIFLSDWYSKQDGPIEIIGLAFERPTDQKAAMARLQKMKDRFDIRYDLALAGPADNDAAAAALPMLNHVMSFPTTIFLDRKHRVRRIHTGFTGPGTGEYYEEWVREFGETVDEISK